MIDKAHRSRRIPGGMGPVSLALAGAVLLLCLIPSTQAQKKRKKKPPNPYMIAHIAPDQMTKARHLLGKKIRKVGLVQPGEKLVKVLARKAHLDVLKKNGVVFSNATRRVPYKLFLSGFEAREGKAVRIHKGRIVVNDGYHDNEMVTKLLEAFHRRHPGITRLHQIGKSTQGRPLWALKISDNAAREEDEPAVLFNGGHHGSELLSTEFVLDIIDQLLHRYRSSSQVRARVDRYEIWCVPLVNPDGNHRFLHVCGTGRKNGRDTNKNGRIDRGDGVDLNRNYPFRWHSLGEKGSSGKPEHGRYRGPGPGSEPETRAMMALAEAQRFVVSISFHTAATKILVPYTIDEVKNPEPSVAWILGRKMAGMADSFRRDRKYKAVRKLYPVDGVDQDWHYFRYGTLAFLIEGPRNNPPYERDRNGMVKGIRPAWSYLLDVIAEGPTVSGHVLDAVTGAPLEAEVAVKEIRCFEGESHTSHPVSGRFDRLVPAPGRYHLLFKKKGYKAEEVEVSPGKEWMNIQVRLKPEE